MTVKTEGLEYNILGCQVRIKPDEVNQDNAINAVELVRDEIVAMRTMNPSLKEIDAAVLVALKMASEKLDLEGEYKENVFSLRSGITDALSFIEEVSPGTMEN